jgi:hypothetical protein
VGQRGASVQTLFAGALTPGHLSTHLLSRLQQGIEFLLRELRLTEYRAKRASRHFAGVVLDDDGQYPALVLAL